MTTALLVLVLVTAGAGRLPGMRGYYPPPEPGAEGGVLFAFGYQPFVHVSELVEKGTGWTAQFGWGMRGRSAAVMVAYEESRHKTLAAGEDVLYWRLDAGYGAYITELRRIVAPYLFYGGSLHSMSWGPGVDEGAGGYGAFIGMGVDFLPSTNLFFGFDVACHLWTDESEQGYVTVTATASVFLEF